MTGRSEIRAALANSGEPMTGREVCDALGCDDRKERDLVYKALTIMANGRLGVERLDDGRYTLIPGWKDSRGAATPLGRKPGKAKPTTSPAATVADDLAKPGAIRTPASRYKVTPLPGDPIMLPRRTVRTLLAAIHGAEIELHGDLLDAVIDATREAA